MIRSIVLGAVLAAAPSAAQAQGVRERPSLIGKLVECRAISDKDARVACYDREVAALDEAERKQDVVLVDRAEVRKARRSLFGFTMPKLRIFEGDEKEPEFTRVDATLTSAQRSGGKWLFQLNDGTQWLQSDSEELARTPKAGNRVRIRKAAMGSFFANVETAPAVRVRRVE